MGSSVGISKVASESDLRSAIEAALKFDSRILIEQGLDAREIEVAVLGNSDVMTTLPGEVVKDVAFYDYNAKYIDNQITMRFLLVFLKKPWLRCESTRRSPTEQLLGWACHAVTSS